MNNNYTSFAKSLLARYLFVIGFILLSILSSPAQKNLSILYTNDIESVYEPLDAFWNDSIDLIGGLPYLSTLIQQIRAKEEISFLFDAGDIFTGSLSAATEGELPFDVYSSMGYDAICLGNHEFEYGWERLLHVKQRARFPVLNCNIFYENTSINFCQSYTILEKQGIRIGLIGLMGIDAFINTMNPAHRIGLEVKDPIPIVQNIVNEIRKEVDLIILLTHQNKTAPMQTDKEADPEVQRGFDEDYEMAGKLSGVDIIFGGHSDNGLWEPVVHPKTGTLICLTFGQSKYLGYLNLNINDKKISIKEHSLIPVNADVLKPDKKINQLVQQVRQENEELTEILGTIDKPGFRKYNRESSLGNLMADMLKEISKADIGLINSGALRADLNAGDITTEELSNIYPFIDKYHVVEIDGTKLKELLEYSYKLPYGIAQLSGVSSKYNSKNPVGKRLIEASINGIPLDESKKYRVASTAFVANGGDGYSILKNGKLIHASSKSLIEYFIEYVKSKKRLALPALGRQIDVSRK